jgi:hypothetical protein
MRSPTTIPGAATLTSTPFPRSIGAVQLVRSFSKKGIIMKRDIIAAAIAGAAALISTGAGAVNLVENGDFDNTAFLWSDNTGFSSNDFQTPGGVDIPGWSNVSGFANEFWVTTPNGYSGLTASPGNGSTFFVDLTGQANSQPFGGLEQTISTTAGAKYVLTFALGAATTWNLGALAGSALTASATGASLLASELFTASTPTTANQWQTETLSFTADSASTTIEFLGDSVNTASRYIGLDDVSVSPDVSPAVPETSTWAMMLAGFASLGFVGFRRAAKARAAI